MTQPLPPDFEPWEAEEVQQPVRRKLKPGVKTALFSLIIIAVLAVFLFGSLFRIRTVTVVGNRQYTVEQIMDFAGIEEGISYFTVTEEYLKAHIEKNHYLIYQGMEKHIPGTLTLYISERQEWANISVMGINYLLDEEGMVLRRTDDGLAEDYPAVTGMYPRSIVVGKKIVPGNEEQLNAYQALIDELMAQGITDDIAELIVSDPEKLYLLTRDGYRIGLGNAEQLRAKIGTARAVVAKLAAMGYKGGQIDASIPFRAIYTPDD